MEEMVRGTSVTTHINLTFCFRVPNAFHVFFLFFFLEGKNNGKGYYIYERGSKPKPDPSVLPIIEESRRLTNIMPGGKVLLAYISIQTFHLHEIASYCLKLSLAHLCYS